MTLVTTDAAAAWTHLQTKCRELARAYPHPTATDQDFELLDNSEELWVKMKDGGDLVYQEKVLDTEGDPISLASWLDPQCQEVWNVPWWDSGGPTHFPRGMDHWQNWLVFNTTTPATIAIETLGGSCSPPNPPHLWQGRRFWEGPGVGTGDILGEFRCAGRNLQHPEYFDLPDDPISFANLMETCIKGSVVKASSFPEWWDLLSFYCSNSSYNDGPLVEVVNQENLNAVWTRVEDLSKYIIIWCTYDKGSLTAEDAQINDARLLSAYPVKFTADADKLTAVVANQILRSFDASLVSQLHSSVVPTFLAQSNTWLRNYIATLWVDTGTAEGHVWRYGVVDDSVDQDKTPGVPMVEARKTWGATGSATTALTAWETQLTQQNIFLESVRKAILQLGKRRVYLATNGGQLDIGGCETDDR